MAENPLLQVKNLSVAFGNNTVVTNISFDLHQNEILGIVGESGSGKSVSSLAILKLLPKRISKITSGSILFDEKDLIVVPEKNFQTIRGVVAAKMSNPPIRFAAVCRDGDCLSK